MQTLILILSNALFLALVLMFVALDRRVTNLEHRRTRDIERQTAHNAETELALAALREEFAPEPAASVPLGFDEGLADIFGYGLENFAKAAFDTEDGK